MIANLKLIFKILEDNLKKKLYKIFFLSLIASFIETLGILTVIPVINIIFQPEIFLNYLNKSFFFKFNVDIKLIFYFTILFLLLFFLIKSFFLFYNEKYNLRFQKKIRVFFTIKLYTCYIKAPFSMFNDYKFSEKIRNIGEVDYIVNFINSVRVLTLDLILFCALAFSMIYINLQLTIIISSISILVGCFIYLFVKKKVKKISEIRRLGNFELINDFLNVLNALKEVTILKRTNYFINSYIKTINQITNANINQGLINASPKIIFEFILILILLCIMVFEFEDKSNQINLIQSLGFFTLASLKIVSSINRIVMHFQNLKFLNLSTKLICNEIIKLNSFSFTKNFSNTNKINFNQEITFQSVNFKYNNNDIIKNSNFVIKKNSIVGLIGSSGTGKSTLINLLLGFLQPNNGKILIDGVDLKKNCESWQNSIGYVPQDIFLINDTIKKNIFLGIEKEDYNQYSLNEILEDSNLNEFIDKLPLGMDSRVGERGSNISGGQAQRIVIARALLKNPEILILDEATSKLDEKNELYILEKISRNLRNKKTVLIVSHRPNTLKNFCDEIYEIKDKKVSLVFKKNQSE